MYICVGGEEGAYAPYVRIDGCGLPCVDGATSGVCVYIFTYVCVCVCV